MAILPVLENYHKKQRTSDCRTLLADVTVMFQIKLRGAAPGLTLQTVAVNYLHSFVLFSRPHYVLSTAPIKKKKKPQEDTHMIFLAALLLQRLLDDDNSKTGRLTTEV